MILCQILLIIDIYLEVLVILAFGWLMHKGTYVSYELIIEEWYINPLK